MTSSLPITTIALEHQPRDLISTKTFGSHLKHNLHSHANLLINIQGHWETKFVQRGASVYGTKYLVRIRTPNDTIIYEPETPKYNPLSPNCGLS
jgi:hypothetical protein